MKSLKESLFDSKTQTVIESLFDKDLVTKDIMYHPETKNELKDCIREQLEIQGPNANLNMIDTSKIEDMSLLFRDFQKQIKNIDISKWNVSNVRDMRSMFWDCKKFNSDLSKWDVSNVELMDNMFFRCFYFNSDLSKWDVSNVENTEWMFGNCIEFNSDLSKWDVSNVEDMCSMFYGCEKFNSDLSKWDVSDVKDMRGVFFGCKSLKKIPSWYEKS